MATPQGLLGFPLQDLAAFLAGYIDKVRITFSDASTLDVAVNYVSSSGVASIDGTYTIDTIPSGKTLTRIDIIHTESLTDYSIYYWEVTNEPALTGEGKFDFSGHSFTIS